MEDLDGIVKDALLGFVGALEQLPSDAQRAGWIHELTDYVCFSCGVCHEAKFGAEDHKCLKEQD